MVSLEAAAKLVGLAAAGLTVAAPVVLFFSYRADYVRAKHPEATLLAFQLTLSSLRKLKKFKAGDVEHPHRRSGDHTAHGHVRAADMGTVSRSASELGMPRRTPDRGARTTHPTAHKRKSHDADE